MSGLLFTDESFKAQICHCFFVTENIVHWETSCNYFIV